MAPHRVMFMHNNDGEVTNSCLFFSYINYIESNYFHSIFFPSAIQTPPAVALFPSRGSRPHVPFISRSPLPLECCAAFYCILMPCASVCVRVRVCAWCSVLLQQYLILLRV